MVDIRFENNRSSAYDGFDLIGECDFEDINGVWTVTHTEVSKDYGGQGIAKRLVQCVVENAKTKGVKIKPVCSYVVNEFEKNPGVYSDVKAYSFYGWESADAKPVEKEYEKIKNPRHLYDLLNNIWCAETCAPRMRNSWNPSNKTLGQCSITAFLAQDIFGGKVYGILRSGGNFHCYNVIGNCIFDLTSEQFGTEELIYVDNPEQSRDVHFSKEEKKLRYEYLRNELHKLLQ